MKEFDLLVQTISTFQGIFVYDSLYDLEETYITFQCSFADSLGIITSQVQELKEQYQCKILTFPDPEISNNTTYQLIFRGSEELLIRAITVLNRMLQTIILTGSTVKAKQQELGVPDLSLTTIRQMAIELKKRDNLCFAVVWIEDNERDNIAIEGSGNPTQLVGLLSRGLHMTIEWADKNIKFHKPKEE